jgi:hypothetical protein
LPTNTDTNSELELLQPSDHTLDPTMIRSDGTQPQEETSKTTEENVLLFTVHPTLIKDTLPSGTVLTVFIWLGGSIKDSSNGQDNHSRMELDSKSELE